jgi:hypothetical protein
MPALTREKIMTFIKATWPCCTVKLLREEFPKVATRALEDLHRRYTHYRERKDGHLIYTLTWLKGRTVWAMDYTEPSSGKIDGMFKKLLNIRDLASGKTLASLPVEEESAEHTKALLRALFRQHDAPLVLKCDNGSTLIAECVLELLDTYGVTILRSPPYWPQYNGACEAGNGAIKVRLHHIAAANGRETEPSCDDVEAAVMMANELIRPTRHNGLSPDGAWASAPLVTPEDRAQFKSCLQKNREAVSIEVWAKIQTDATDKEIEEAHAKIERDAITRTLVGAGLLVERRKRIPLYKKS